MIGGMRTPAPLIAGLLALAACGGGGGGGSGGAGEAERSVMQPRTEPAAEAVVEGRARAGTRVRVRRSEYGRMLFDSRGQAIYIFERDRKRRSVCYGECARAWPPVFTRGRPVAGKGVRARLLGTIERRGGRRQITYAGKPLYFYAHEGPGEVLCHDVNLNGGLWWVVGPDGVRRP